MKGLGKGVKSFKEGINDIDDQIKEIDKTPAKKDGESAPKE